MSLPASLVIARVGHIDRLTEASFISLNPDEPGLGEHLDAGRRAMLADSGALWLAEADRRVELATHHHDLSPPLLAAVAAAWALGLSAPEIEQGLAALPRGGAERPPG